MGLRSSGGTVAIQAETGEGQTVIGVIGTASAPARPRRRSILHEGQSYNVQELDLENGLAHVAYRADYYTNVVAETRVETLTERQITQ